MATKRPVALVTGASSGIGKAAALALATAGHEVIGTSRNTAHVIPLKGVTFLDLDVTSDASVADAVAEVIEKFGRIDVLVDNAGIGTAGAAEESSAAQAQAQALFDINVFGVIRMTHAVQPHMRAQHSGRVINISSVVGFMPQPYMAVYAATKHAVEDCYESVDHELCDGVRVLLVEPARTSTAFDAASVRPDQLLDVYAHQRHVFEQYMAGAVRDGDDPAVVADEVVAAATDTKPKLHCTAGAITGRVRPVRRIIPTRMFDQQLRTLDRLPTA